MSPGRRRHLNKCRYGSHLTSKEATEFLPTYGVGREVESEQGRHLSEPLPARCGERVVRQVQGAQLSDPDQGVRRQVAQGVAGQGEVKQGRGAERAGAQVFQAVSGEVKSFEIYVIINY